MMPAKRAEKDSRKKSAKSTARMRRAILARALLIFGAMVAVSISREYSGNSLSSSALYSSHYLSPESSVLVAFSSFSGSATFCNPEVSYQDQPAECQIAADQHRQTIFIIVALSGMSFLLAALLATKFFG